MQRVPAQPLVYEFSRHCQPRCRVKPGETFCVESEDALSGQIRSAGDRRDKSVVPYSNPVAGPIVVDGAEKGDYLAVTIKSIEPRDGQCATYTGAPKQLVEWLGAEVPHGAHVSPIRDGFIHWKERIQIPYQPMLGCIGTAPDWGVPTTGPAGPHGGNMDLVEVCPGSTLFLPVSVPGGYLYLGDAHAAMGHGELSATGLEMAAWSTIQVDLLRGSPLTGIRIANPEFLMTVATQNSPERAIAEAYARLILWMEVDYGWNRWDAYDLLTHVGRISIGYYGSGTVGCGINRKYVGPAVPVTKKE
ncbi:MULTISPECIES: acetamidase/formamidase family protein [unclassified Schlesneria]|uniref:acetamidase/formamidase family protein n=1 Tax=unclassified Schlesneria TaxID=2762017 RepID=UPI002EF875CD